MEIQSANQQHPVPQNVMDVEFKLIGDLTVRQFTYLCVFSGLIFLTWYFPLPAIFRLPMIGIELFLGFGFAFLPLNDIPMDKWVVNYITAITNPRLRVWKHKANIPYFFIMDTTQTKLDNKEVVRANNTQRKSIEELLTQTRKKPNFDDDSDLEEKEKEFMSKLGLKYQTQDKKQTAPLPEVSNINNNFALQPEPVVVKEPTLHEDELETKQQFSSIVVNKQVPQTVKQETKPEIPQIQKTTPQFSQDKLVVKQYKEDDKKPITTQTQQEHDQYLKHLEELNMLKQKLLEEIEKNQLKIVKGREKEIEEIAKTENEKRLKELGKLKDENKQLEERLRRLEMQKQEQKVIKVEVPVQKIEERKEDTVHAPHVQELPKEKQGSSIFTGFLEKLHESKNKDLPKLDTSAAKQKEEALFKNQSKENTKVEDAQINTEPTQKEEPIKVEKDKWSIDKVEKNSSPIEERKDIPTKGNKGINIIRGSAIDTENNIISECIVIIKDEESDPVRALKSNQLGEFEITTPLNNGIYSVEGIKEGYEFKPLKIEALGTVLSPVKLIGKKL